MNPLHRFNQWRKRHMIKQLEYRQYERAIRKGGL